MKEKIGAAVLASALAVSGSGIAETNELIDKSLVTPDPIVETGVMSSQRELDLTSQQEKEEVDKIFAEYLAGVGEYDEKKINNKLMRSGGSFRDLGFYEAGLGYVFSIQAILLHCENGDKDQYLALGTKDKKGDRVVVVAKWPTSLLAKPGVEKLSVGTRSGNLYDSINFDNEDDARKYSCELIGKCLQISFVYDDFDKSSYEGELLNYFNYLVSRSRNNLDFVAGLLFPKEKTLSSADTELVKMIKNTKTVIKNIDNLTQMHQVIKDNEELPTTHFFSYNFYER